MLIVQVYVRVKPEFVATFAEATRQNANASLLEPGIARFDILQQSDEPHRFVLVEVYRTADASAAHKTTTHYQTWRDAVAPMMAEPRASVKYSNCFPDDNHW